MEAPQMAEVRRSWERIEKWLKKEVPKLAGNLPGPATVEAIETVEAVLGLRFPVDLRESYLIQNGVDYSDKEINIFPPELDGIMDMAFCLLPVERVDDEWRVWAGLIDIKEFEGYKSEPQPGITDEWWSKGWIPVAGNGGGDFICVDMAPVGPGRVGQVILAWHDSSERRVLADSWAAYLEKVAETMEQGKMRYDEDYGMVVGG